MTAAARPSPSYRSPPIVPGFLQPLRIPAYLNIVEMAVMRLSPLRCSFPLAPGSLLLVFEAPLAPRSQPLIVEPKYLHPVGCPATLSPPPHCPAPLAPGSLLHLVEPKYLHPVGCAAKYPLPPHPSLPTAP